MTPQNNVLQSRTLRFFFLGWILLFSGVPFSASAKIVFCVDDDLFVMDDGSHRRRLTHNTTAFDTHPRWSPDRRRIAFTRYMDKTQTQTTAEVFILTADGSNPQRLTHNNVIDVDSSWSPDGEHIAFSSTRSGDWRVYVLEVATRAVRQITDAPSAAPDWSSDGREITFERSIELPNGISPKTIKMYFFLDTP